MSRDPLPEPWRTALEPKGIHSKRGLASKVGISPQTAKRLIDGEGSPSHQTVAAVADAVFNGDRNKVWELAGIAREDHGDWNLPTSLTSQLDPEQRKAVLAVVRAMLPPDQRRGDGDDRDATPMNPEGRVIAYTPGGQIFLLEEKGPAGHDPRVAMAQLRRMLGGRPVPNVIYFANFSGTPEEVDGTIGLEELQQQAKDYLAGLHVAEAARDDTD